MRFKHTIVVLLIALVGTTTLSVTGQEEPLPAIKARGSFEPLTPSIVLTIEPNGVYTQPTLVDAARANNYFMFDALYRDAVRRGESVAAFAALHELWTYGITDPIGAFYGIEKYERLARMYPGYASYIEGYRIIDSNGSVFYPTSETRTFLLDRALESRAPRVQVAENTRPTQSEQQRSVSSGTPTSSAAAPVAPVLSEAEGSRRRVSPKARTKAPVSERTETKIAPEAPVVVAEKSPVVVAEKPPAVIAEKPPVAVETPIAETPATEAPVVVRAEPQTSDAPNPVPQPIAANNDFGSRGIFLLLIGILGIGILAMMLRAPRELPPSIMTPQAPPSIVAPPGDKASAPVEPIRRPSAAPPPPSGKNRAGGSHG